MSKTPWLSRVMGPRHGRHDMAALGPGAQQPIAHGLYGVFQTITDA
jgi:hypothetical protein